MPIKQISAQFSFAGQALADAAAANEKGPRFLPRPFVNATGR
jgi:hypothetical protein